MSKYSRVKKPDMDFQPLGEWSLSDLRQFASSISAIYNFFFILNHFENHPGVKNLLSRKDRYHNVLLPSFDFLIGLDDYTTHSEKLIIDKMEMGSPDEVRLRAEDWQTVEDTKRYVSQEKEEVDMKGD